MTDNDRPDWLTGLRAQRRPASPDPDAGCLDHQTVAAMVEGGLEAEARKEALAHLAGCATCRSAVSSVARLVTNPEVRREVARLAPRSGRQGVWLAVGVATAATLLLILRPSVQEAPDTHRSHAITASPAPDAVWPVGPVARVPSLRWTTVSGADRYRVTLFGAGGSELYVAELTDTVLELPDSVGLVPGGSYWWRVDARVGFDRWAGSALFEFTLEGDPR